MDIKETRERKIAEIAKRKYPSITNDIASIVEKRDTGSGLNGTNSNSKQLNEFVRKLDMEFINANYRTEVMEDDAELHVDLTTDELERIFPQFENN